jgi:hypothetical protein
MRRLFDRCFWLGDFNYRVDLPRGDVDRWWWWGGAEKEERGRWGRKGAGAGWWVQSMRVCTRRDERVERVVDRPCAGVWSAA